MKALSISQVTKTYDVTPRMLRHYEKMGLIQSSHKEDYAYRMYDEEAVRRLQQIIILRKLRIPLKNIGEILDDSESVKTLDILRDNLSQTEEEINALTAIRSILKALSTRLEEHICLKTRFDMLSDRRLGELSAALSVPKTNLLKEEYSVDELNKAEKTLGKQSDVRIIMLPPFTVASNHVIGKDPEESVGQPIDKFIRDSGLYEKKPDSRYFGFNHPNPGILEDGIHGYEVWVTIPDDWDVPEPLVKKHFDGGLYAAMTISFPDFYRWGDLEAWVKNSDVYELNYSELGLEIMGGCLEEHLNWVYSAHMGWPENGIDGQLDLLMPIKKKEK